MLRKLIDFFLMSQGISSTAEDEEKDKWARFRAEREEWERRQQEEGDPAGTDAPVVEPTDPKEPRG
jgi:hypothetical protein